MTTIQEQLRKQHEQHSLCTCACHPHFCAPRRFALHLHSAPAFLHAAATRSASEFFTCAPAHRGDSEYTYITAPDHNLLPTVHQTRHTNTNHTKGKDHTHHTTDPACKPASTTSPTHTTNPSCELTYIITPAHYPHPTANTYARPPTDNATSAYGLPCSVQRSNTACKNQRTRSDEPIAKSKNQRTRSDEPIVKSTWLLLVGNGGRREMERRWTTTSGVYYYYHYDTEETTTNKHKHNKTTPLTQSSSKTRHSTKRTHSSHKSSQRATTAHDNNARLKPDHTAAPQPPEKRSRPTTPPPKNSTTTPPRHSQDNQVKRSRTRQNP